MTSLQSARGRRLTTTWPLPSHLQDVVMGLPHSHVKIGLSRRSHAPGRVRGTPGTPLSPPGPPRAAPNPKKQRAHSGIKSIALRRRFSVSTPLRPVPGRQSPVHSARAFAPRVLTQPPS